MVSTGQTATFYSFKQASCVNEYNVMIAHIRVTWIEQGRLGFRCRRGGSLRPQAAGQGCRLCLVSSGRSRGHIFISSSPGSQCTVSCWDELSNRQCTITWIPLLCWSSLNLNFQCFNGCCIVIAFCSFRWWLLCIIHGIKCVLEDSNR